LTAPPGMPVFPGTGSSQSITARATAGAAHCQARAHVVGQRPDARDSSATIPQARHAAVNSVATFPSAPPGQTADGNQLENRSGRPMWRNRPRQKGDLDNTSAQGTCLDVQDGDRPGRMRSSKGFVGCRACETGSHWQYSVRNELIGRLGQEVASISESPNRMQYAWSSNRNSRSAGMFTHTGR